MVASSLDRCSLGRLSWCSLASSLAFVTLGVGACSTSSSSSGGADGGEGGVAAGAQALFVVPASLDDLNAEHWLDHPWPSDLRRDADGTIHALGFFNPHDTIILDLYIKTTKGLLTGFSPAASGYFRFTNDIDPASLPATPQATLDSGASVQLIDIDPASPEHGKRRLLQTFWQQADGVYWLKDTLAVMPALGYPLLPKTRYAIVATNALKAMDGTPVQPSPDLAEVLGTVPTSARVQAAHDLFAPAVSEVQKAGIATANIAQLTFFTTNDPTAELFKVVDDVHAHVAAPTVLPNSWTQAERATNYDVYQGEYGPSPNYQAGTIPYLQPADGGNFVFDASGKPVVQNLFNLRFTFVVPNADLCPQPAAGYPLTIYAHGTGGDYRSIVDEGNSVGDALASRCVASMGTDQIFHGARPGAPPASDPNREGDIELIFFNLNNPAAARTNGRQSAIDVVQQARLFTETHISVPAAVSRTGAELKIDWTRLTFFGHSQGGLNGSLYLGSDPSSRGGVLSGSGSQITVALLEKTQPQPSVAAAVKTVLQLIRPEEQAELNLFHPTANLVQELIDVTDPLHYVGYIALHPRNGGAPKSVYQTEGINADGTGDSYAPPHGIEIGSVATGLPRMAPGIHTVAEEGFSAMKDVTIPADGLSGNLAGGKATGVLAQWVPAPMDDGHFVVFNVPKARAQAAGFCKNLADDPKGRVPAP